MSIVLYIVTMNLDVLSGIKSKVIYLVPILVFGSAICGYFYASILSRLLPSYQKRLAQLINNV